MSAMTVQVRQVVVRYFGNGIHLQHSSSHFEYGIAVESERDYSPQVERSMMVVRCLSQTTQTVAKVRVPGNGPFSTCCTRRSLSRLKELKMVDRAGPRERLERAVLQLRKPCSLWFETKTRSQRLSEVSVKRGRRTNSRHKDNSTRLYLYCTRGIKRATIWESRTKNECYRMEEIADRLSIDGSLEPLGPCPIQSLSQGP